MGIQLASNMYYTDHPNGNTISVGGKIDIKEFLSWAGGQGITAHMDADMRMLFCLNLTPAQIVLLKLTWGGK